MTDDTPTDSSRAVEFPEASFRARTPSAPPVRDIRRRASSRPSRGAEAAPQKPQVPGRRDREAAKGCLAALLLVIIIGASGPSLVW